MDSTTPLFRLIHRPLQRANSMLTFEGTQSQGVEAIVEKLTSLPFQKVVHKVSTRDCQPTGDGNSLVVTVTGQLIVDDSPAPLNFSQVSSGEDGS